MRHFHFLPDVGLVNPASGGGAGSLKSLQQVNIDFGTSTSITKNTTITSVDASNTRLIMAGMSANPDVSDIIRDSLFYTEITSNTTLRSSRDHGTSVNGRVKQSVLVAEYQPGVIKSIQRFSLVMASGDAVVTQGLDPAVDVSKSFIDLLGAESPSSLATLSNWHYFMVIPSFNSGSEIQLSRLGSTLGANAIFQVQVVEFY